VAASFIGSDKVSPLWLITIYFIHTVGELCFSPVGLSTVTKLAPLRIAGLMMGVWFLSLSLGNYGAGWAAGFYQDNATTLVWLFGILALVSFIGSVILGLMAGFIRKLAQQA
ncbi:MAG: MFS transporter, partial [Acidobacteriota bacterium]